MARFVEVEAVGVRNGMPVLNCGGKGGKPGPCPTTGGGKGKGKAGGGKGGKGFASKMSDSELVSKLKVATKVLDAKMQTWLRMEKGPARDKLDKEMEPLMKVQGAMHTERINRQLSVKGEKVKKKISEGGAGLGLTTPPISSAQASKVLKGLGKRR